MKTKYLIIFIIALLFLQGCAMKRMYYPVFTVEWKDSIRNPENDEFVDEVSFNEDIPFNQVTQEQFNKRYEIELINN